MASFFEGHQSFFHETIGVNNKNFGGFPQIKGNWKRMSREQNHSSSSSVIIHEIRLAGDKPAIRK